MAPSATPSSPPARKAPRTVDLPRLLLAGTLLLALLLRLIDVGAFAAVDEQKYAKRATAFYNAISQGKLEQTFQSAHPAVITLWIGAASAAGQSWQRHGQLCPTVTIRPADDPGACVLDELTLITQLHRGYALITWGLLAVSALGLWRLYGARRAVWPVALLAFDPYLLAHSRLAHNEGVVAHAVLAAALLLALYARGGRRWLLPVAGIIGGLALAEKLPGAYAWLLAAALLGWRARRLRAQGRWLGRWAVDLGLFTMAMLGTVAAIWPVLWVAPRQAIGAVLADVSFMLDQAETGSVHLLLGAVREAAATPLLYALTLVFRLTPLTLPGLLLALGWAAASREARRELGPWLLYAAAFLVIMSLGVKQAGRYILTAFAPIDVAAGLVWWRLGRAALQRWPRLRAGWLPQSALLGLPLLALAAILPTAPYYVAAYNWLTGGPRVAARVIDIGLGEGLDQAARQLNTLPDAERLVVATGYREAFEPYFDGESASLSYDHVYRADHVVFYIDQWQKRPDWSLWHTYRDREPWHTVTLLGVPYAHIYATERPEAALTRLNAEAAPTDLVVAEIESLVTRGYAGAAPLWLPDDDAAPEAALAALDAALAGAERVWWLVYPRSRGEHGEALGEVIAARTAPVEALEDGELRLELRQPLPHGR